jgi:predicted RNA-binding protein YlxR (DUF448 family)
LLLLFLIIGSIFFFIKKKRIISLDIHSLRQIPTDPRVVKWIRENKPQKPVKIYLDDSLINIFPQGRDYHCISNASEDSVWNSCPFLSLVTSGSRVVFVSYQLENVFGFSIGASIDRVISQIMKISKEKNWDFWEQKIYNKNYEHLQVNKFTQLHIYKKNKVRYFIFTREASDLSLIRMQQEDIIKKLLKISRQKINIIDKSFLAQNYGEENLVAPIMVPTIGGKIYYESRELIFCKTIKKYKKELVRLVVFYINQLASESSSLFTERIYYLNRKIGHIIQNLQQESLRRSLMNNKEIYFDVQKSIEDYLKKSPNISYHKHRIIWENNWKDNKIPGKNIPIDNLCAGIAFLIGEYPMEEIKIILDENNNRRRICLVGLPESVDSTLVHCLTNHRNIKQKKKENSTIIYFYL